MITLINHALRSYIARANPWSWEFLTWQLYNLQLWRHGTDVKNSLYAFGQSEKELESSMYNKAP